MSKQRNNDATKDVKDENMTGTGRAGRKSSKDQIDRKADQKRRSRRRPNGNRNPKEDRLSRNTALNGANIETPVTGASLLWPTDCASMQAFGNYTTTPGQDNFITDYNVIDRSPTATDLPITIKASSKARRTANAMRIDVMSLFGTAKSDSVGLWENPIMLSAVNLKQFCDTSFGTNTNYSPEDLALYLMAIAGVFPMFAEIRRDLRLAVTYIQNQFPQFVPQGLFALLAIPDESDPSQPYAGGEGAMFVAKHLRSFIDQYNQLVITFNRLPIPPELGLFGYNDDLFESIYMDSMDITTAQLYVFHNSHAWWYFEELSDEGASLVPIEISDNSITRKLLYLSEAIKRISNLRTDSAAMLQNLFNAYGSRDLLRVPTLDINTLAPLDFVYEPGIMSAIENMVLCNPDEVSVSRYQAISSTSNVSFHIWANTAQKPACMMNLPLQFHKPYTEINQLDLGWAMRFHPSFRNQTSFDAYVGTDVEPTHLSHVVADGNHGFGIVRRVWVCELSDSAAMTMSQLMSQGWDTSSRTVYLKMLDFAARPMLIYYTLEPRSESDPIVFTLQAYTAERDVECTYRVEDTHMMWIYLTQTVWASNVNRSVTGTRTRS